MLVVPLILIYLYIDRKQIFHIAFFGFASHALFAYVDTYGIRHGLRAYPYQLMPFLSSFSLDAAFIPAAIMFLYQWTVNHHKNYFLYSTGLAVIFGFGFKPLLSFLELFERYKWVNYFYIFLIYVGLFWAAYGITKLFRKMREDTPETVEAARQAKRRLRWKLEPGRK
ncbi:hypothetical protein [Marinicrinis lubricantis]|uniref:Uncharacterized protein n=1 Tax=Marinicrinis lubricantis TaxID=2086470 RepID=A0ABW1ILZ5_9BACL